MAKNKLTTPKVIEQFKKAHGDKYDYSQFEYISNHAKSVIICPVHGRFEQKPSSHKRGTGCRECQYESTSRNNSFSKSEVIEKFKSAHGDRYDYSLVEYKNQYDKVTIICPEHNAFTQLPKAHWQGQNCPRCARIESADKCRMSQDEFIRRSVKAHGDKYDYSLSVYVNSATSVLVMCSKHGQFLQSPRTHMAGGGCEECSYVERGLNGRYTQDEMIDMFRRVHGDKYDYSLVNYSTALQRVDIICDEHGIFSQTPSDHKSGRGCLACYRDRQGDCSRISLADTLRQFRNVHGDKYDYSLIGKVEHSKDKLKILCDTHGPFFQSAGAHKRGNGCPSCKGDANAIRHLLTWEETLESFRSAHGETYSYVQDSYVDSKTPMSIVCKEHGLFAQSPASHKIGQGCHACGRVRTRLSHLLTWEETLESFRSTHGQTYGYIQDSYTDSKTPMSIVCEEHGIFAQSPAAHKKGQGCPVCSFSLGELAVSRFLESREIFFNGQHTFPECKSERSLFFDFYIPSFNCCIEYHGKQHYGTVDNNFFGGELALKKRQHRDQIKRDYCTANDITLIEIPYWEEDIENFLLLKFSEYGLVE